MLPPQVTHFFVLFIESFHLYNLSEKKSYKSCQWQLLYFFFWESIKQTSINYFPAKSYQRCVSAETLNHLFNRFWASCLHNEDPLFLSTCLSLKNLFIDEDWIHFPHATCFCPVQKGSDTSCMQSALSVLTKADLFLLKLLYWLYKQYFYKFIIEVSFMSKSSYMQSTAIWHVLMVKLRQKYNTELELLIYIYIFFYRGKSFF